MSLLVYASENDSIGRQLHKIIEDLALSSDTEFIQDFQELSSRLRRPKFNIEITVLLAKDRQELDILVAIHELLRDLRIVLIVPDSEQETLSKGHSLRPRYLAQAHSELGDVRAVLEKMIQSSTQSSSHTSCN